MKQPLFALVDCNNFFVSCERVFRPDLENKPVVVLSSNDGCAVARSNEVKALGVPMGAPAFKYRELFRRHNVIQFSANFDLYGDISRRITDLLTTLTPRIEIYSVDESFLDISELPIKNYAEWGSHVRESIGRLVGVPVSIGIASTKTLAKLGSEYAKKHPETNGVCGLIQDNNARQKIMESFPIQDVWGVGRQFGPMLRGYQLFNAWQLSQIRPQLAQSLMGIRGRQMVAELQGTSCYGLSLESRMAKSIARTRTFGQDTSNSHAIEAALATFAHRAAFRLRKDHQLARGGGLFLTTNKHKPGYQTWSQELHFTHPTADTGKLIHAFTSLFQEIRQGSVLYHRAGVWLSDFVPDNAFQSDLFDPEAPGQHSLETNRMLALDTINERYGKQALRFATEHLGHTWEPRHNIRSPRYTSHWSDLPVLHIHP